MKSPLAVQLALLIRDLRRLRFILRAIIVLLVLAFALIAVDAVYGQTPTEHAYGGSSSRNSPDASLPFTGLDAVLLFAVGFWLVALGMVLRLRRRRA